MGKKLYVGNLSYETTDASLEQLFAPFGEVRSAQVIQDRDTGRSKGFGFVEMSDDNAARAAIQALNEKEHDGRRLTVNEARPREERSGGGGGGGGRGRGGGGGGYGGRWRWWRLRTPLTGLQQRRAEQFRLCDSLACALPIQQNFKMPPLCACGVQRGFFLRSLARSGQRVCARGRLLAASRMQIRTPAPARNVPCRKRSDLRLSICRVANGQMQVPFWRYVARPAAAKR